LQQAILVSEGVKFDDKGRCDLNLVLWAPGEADTQDRKSSLLQRTRKRR